ncbi:MAG: hypothetical protein ACI9R3_001242 [Verrucomicrobiales bacterium]|jgi:hypothetical protein
MPSTTRRENLKHLSGLGVTALAGGILLPEHSIADDPSGKIATENAKPGTRDWMLTKPKVDASNRCPWVEGYCSHNSIRAGETLTLHVSTNPAAAFSVDVFRLGYYGGAGGRLMKRLEPFKGVTHLDPPIGAMRARICEWPATAEITIPDEWLSGVYVGKLTEHTNGTQSYVIFIVRDDRKADFLYQCSDNTWQSYNRWPSTFSLYDSGDHEWFWGKGVQVSYRRPYAKYRQILDAPLSTGSGEFFLWEFPFVYWMESLGFDVSYISNTDTHSDPAGLLRGRGFLSVGHDEYWSIEMFRNVQGAISKGVSVGFFSGNAVCGRIVFDESTHSFERVGVFGPPGGTREFHLMKSLTHERPYANELVGAHSTGPVTGGADWVCSLPDHWIYNGTGMKRGDRIPGVIGWEWHGDPADIPGLEIVATGPTQSAPGEPNGGVYTATVYPGPHKNIVFNAATCWWADGLSEPPGYVRPKVYTEPKGPDDRLQRITRNVLDRMRLG